MPLVMNGPDGGNCAGTETIIRIKRILNTIGDPCSVASGTPMGIEEMGLIKELHLDSNGHLRIAMRLTAPLCHNVGYFNVEIKNRLLALDEVQSLDITMDHGLEWTPENISQQARERRMATLRRYGLTRESPHPVRSSESSNNPE
jgi:metal-sulfur cluster biosynthetic enzyme